MACGQIYQRYGNELAALEWFARAHDLNPGQPDVSREASISAMALGRSDEAISYASSAVTVRPNDAGLQSNLALAFLLAGKLDQAKQYIEMAIVKDPANQIAKTLSRMIEHFTRSGERPPTRTKELEEYWARRRRS